MLGTDHHYTGLSEEFLAKYGPDDSLGQHARHADAARLLDEMDAAEEEVGRREARVRASTDRIDYLTEDHRLQMDYMVSFGVRAEHRNELRAVLDELKHHCRFSLRQAIDFANARARSTSQKLNGVDELS